MKRRKEGAKLKNVKRFRLTSGLFLLYVGQVTVSSHFLDHIERRSRRDPFTSMYAGIDEDGRFEFVRRGNL